MIPNELQRLILMIALAATGYLLILAWTGDYSEEATRKTVSDTPDLVGSNGVVPGNPVAASSPLDLPSVISANSPGTVGSAIGSAGDSDVPSARMLAPGAAPTSLAAASVTASGQLVSVFTDTLEIWLDMNGGDIVRARLPQYPVTLDAPDEAFTLLDRSNSRTYIAQSGLLGLSKNNARPVFTASAKTFDISGNGSVVLKTTVDGLKVEKIFGFTEGSYAIDVSYRVNNVTAAPVQASFYGQIKRDSKPAVGETSFTLGPQPYLGAALTTAESRYEKVDFEDLDDAPLLETVEGGWVAMLQHYFLSAWVANSEETNRFYGDPKNDGTYHVGYVGPAKLVAAGATGEWHSRFYVGPKDQDKLAEMAENLNLTVDYGFLWWLAVPLFKVLTFMQSIVGNWGVAIILLTFVVKAVLYPLSAASFRSMANMRRVAPQLKRLQERHADDRQKLSQEMMALYKKEKVNPLGGCLPMVLQMPVFLSLYWVLFESVELRQAPFFAWIIDLAAMDKFFVLPILMGASMYLQQTLNPPVADPMQAKVMKFMPIMFTALFLFFPAGLVLYWLTNNVLSMAQQWYTNKQVEGATKAAT